ncbi:helix-turn-helix domain-containing protein, partial [Streptomyces sp. NPDC054835]
MTTGERAPDPREARNPAEFIARLQALKDRSGLTYRELSARAEAGGDVLPRSTVANMLARTTVPREELLAAFVRACGVPPERAQEWETVRAELAVRGRHGGGPDGPAGPGGPGAGAPAAAAPGAAFRPAAAPAEAKPRRRRGRGGRTESAAPVAAAAPAEAQAATPRRRRTRPRPVEDTVTFQTVETAAAALAADRRTATVPAQTTQPVEAPKAPVAEEPKAPRRRATRKATTSAETPVPA